jgi:hypothetical protein
MFTKPELLLKPGTPAAPSFAVMKSPNEELLNEPSLPPLRNYRLYSHAAMARAKAIIEHAEKPAPSTDCGIGALLLAFVLLLAGSIYLVHALGQRDDVQRLQYQRAVAPVLRHD